VERWNHINKLMGSKMKKEGFDREVMTELQRQSEINRQWMEQSHGEMSHDRQEHDRQQGLSAQHYLSE
jgi:hypothetical protein